MQPLVLFDTHLSSAKQSWAVVDDIVMGGQSSGAFYISKEGTAVFQGKVSLENNGGFSMLRSRFKAISVDGYSKIVLRIKGDEKNYQFRIKSKISDAHSFVGHLATPGEWKTVELSLHDLYPQYRGRRIALPTFKANSIEEIAFFIGNKKAERFRLEIAAVTLK